MKMNEEKRKVSTDALETLGTIIGENEKRDAIHLAVIPIVAQESLKPGDHVSSDGRASYIGSNRSVGIVDPFLKNNVKKGERFWLIIYPRQINSLRHIWTHPSFPDDIKEENIIDNDIEKSKKWIESFSKSLEGFDISFDHLMKLANSWLDDFWEREDNSLLQDIKDVYAYKITKEFWYHYEIVTGKKVEEYKKVDFFECCC